VALVGGRSSGGAAASSRHGLLFAAGLITGEALVGILMAIPIVLSDDPNVFAVPFAVPVWMGLLVVVAVTAGLYRVATAAKQP
jgi:hypothetical protein